MMLAFETFPILVASWVYNYMSGYVFLMKFFIGKW